jgi:hypothetical protein
VIGRVVIVRTEEAVPFATGVTETGFKLHPTVALLVTQVNPTVELNPLSEVTVTVEVVELPIDVATERGNADKLKSLIPSVKVAERLCPPPLPLIVIE